MKKLIFVTALILLCNTGVKSQQIPQQLWDSEDLEKWTRKEMANTVDWLYDNFKDFDRECFLTGTLDDSYGHYQTFTANKSGDDINDKVKWLFRKDLKFVPDTVRRQRITTYGRRSDLVLFVTALFKNDYPDLRALRVCPVSPLVRYYGSEVKTALDPKDPVFNYTTGFEIELLSSSLAKTVAGYYNFDYDKVSDVSSGGDIGYPGVIKKEKIATEAQKMSFLAGVFMRYECIAHPDDSIRHTILIRNSLSTAKECVDILKEFTCNNIRIIPTGYTTKHSAGHVVFDASDKVRDLISLVHDLYKKTGNVIVLNEKGIPLWEK
ncbi:MAG: hypothetical protein LBK58_11905 [Prevotellaceae bacterium]|nr:hypothetical protein [Prevotellaceae bacterium]